MLNQEFRYFLEHKDELIQQHLGKFVAIKGEEVVGVYENEADAFIDIVDKHELGTVLIQQCVPGEEHYTQNFHSRVIF